MGWVGAVGMLPRERMPMMPDDNNASTRKDVGQAERCILFDVAERNEGGEEE